jgi:hypothetical protein
MADGNLDIGQPTVKYKVRDLFGIESDMDFQINQIEFQKLIVHTNLITILH